VDNKDCFVLVSTLNDAQSTAGVEVNRHALWGYFSQRTGLLVRLEDTHLLRMPMPSTDAGDSEGVYWETTMKSSIRDYRPIDNINIAHASRTVVTVSQFASATGTMDDTDPRQRRLCTCMEETLSIEEVDLNITGLSNECFVPPRDLLVSISSKEQQRQEKMNHDDEAKGACDPVKAVDDRSDGAGCGIRASVAKKALVPFVAI
jgi:hypothetical protein